MGVQQTVYKTVSCNGPGCDKSVTFEVGTQQTGIPKETEAILSAPENSWMNSTLRTVRTPDGRELVLCSDVCEVNSVAAGNHNKPEPKKIIELPTGGPTEYIRRAAEAAKVKEQADRDLRAGPEVQP